MVSNRFSYVSDEQLLELYIENERALDITANNVRSMEKYQESLVQEICHRNLDLPILKLLK